MAQQREQQRSRHDKERTGGCAREIEREHGAFEAACLPHQAELFGVAMRICREFIAGPNPCNRCCVSEIPNEEVVAGLKSLRALLLV